MNDIRKLLLLQFKDLLEKKPFDVSGYRFEILGSMYMLFGEKEEEIINGMQELGNDVLELGMTLSSYPKRPDILCVMQRSDNGN